MLLHILTLIIAFATAVGCTQQEPQTAAVKSEINGTPNQTIEHLGSGYYSPYSNFVLGQPCVQSAGKIRTVYLPEAEFKAGYQSKSEEKGHHIWTDGKVSGSFQIYKVTGGVSTAHALIDASRKTSTYTTFTYAAGNALLEDVELNERGQMITQNSSDLARFFGCGNEFLYQVKLGGRLHLGLEFGFSSHEFKNSFNIVATGGVKIAGKEKTIQILNESQKEEIEKIKGTVTIIFEQEGGDQEAFAQRKQALPTNCTVYGVVEDTGIGKKTGYLKGYETCVESYKKLLSEYAAKDFPAQFKNLEDVTQQNLNQSGYTALRYFTIPYRNAGYPMLNDVSHKLPAFVTDYLNGDLVKVTATFQALTTEVRALENIFKNTDDQGIASAVIKEVVDQLEGVASPDEALRSLAEASLLMTKVEATLNSCRTAITMKLAEDVEHQDSQWTRTKSELNACKSRLSEKSTDMSKFLNNFTRS